MRLYEIINNQKLYNDMLYLDDLTLSSIKIRYIMKFQTQLLIKLFIL